MELEIGQLYQHYKGGIYKILLLPKSSVDEDNMKQMVVYQDQNAPEKIWVQPLDRFFQSVEWEGKTVPRFQLMSDNS